MRHIRRKKWMWPVLVPMWLLAWLFVPDIKWMYGEIIRGHEVELW